MKSTTLKNDDKAIELLNRIGAGRPVSSTLIVAASKQLAADMRWESKGYPSIFLGTFEALVRDRSDLSAEQLRQIALAFRSGVDSIARSSYEDRSFMDVFSARVYAGQKATHAGSGLRNILWCLKIAQIAENLASQRKGSLKLPPRPAS